MSVRLHLNHRACEAEKGLSLFTQAEKLGVPEYRLRRLINQAQ